MSFLYAEILLSADLELFIISNINIQIVVQVAVKTQLKLKKVFSLSLFRKNFIIPGLFFTAYMWAFYAKWQVACGIILDLQ